MSGHFFLGVDDCPLDARQIRVPSPTRGEGRTIAPLWQVAGRPIFVRGCPYLMRVFAVAKGIRNHLLANLIAGICPRAVNDSATPNAYYAPRAVDCGAHFRRQPGGSGKPASRHYRGSGRRFRRGAPRPHHLLDRPHRPRRPLHHFARTGRRRRHPAICRHRGNRARRADRGRYADGRPAGARDRSAPASRRPAIFHRQFPPRGGRSGQRLHQRRRAHPAHRHRTRREQSPHGAAGDRRLGSRGADRRGRRRRRRRGA